MIWLFGTALLGGAALVCGQSTPDPGAPRPPGERENPRWFGKKEKEPENTRSVSGVVEDPDGKLIEGAIVKLKDAKTLEIRSFITLPDGTYRFHGLSTENDYELQANYEKLESKVRRLSVYDSRKKAVINLKLKPEA